MFINISNHPSANWGEAQKKAAESYGEIVDLTFPHIPPSMSTEKVSIQANKYFSMCKSMLSDTKAKHAIHLAGEPTFCFYLTQQLLTAGYTVLTSTSERIVKQEGDQKISQFKFQQFREFSKYLITKTKKKMKHNKLFHNEKFMFIMLILSFASEKIILDSLNLSFHESLFLPNTGWRFACLLIIILFAVLFTLGWLNESYRANTITMKRILGYAIGFKFISLCIALSFLCQITWFIDAAYPLFMGSFAEGILQTYNSLYAIAQLVIILVFIYITFALFHPLEWLAQKKVVSKNHRTLLVSGFSVAISREKSRLTSFGLDLFLKPFFSYSNIDTILILPSNKTLYSKFSIDTDSTEEAPQFKDFQPLLSSIHLLKEYNDTIEKLEKESNNKELKSATYSIFEKILYESICNVNAEYKNKNIKFHFTEEVDYNVFDTVFEAISTPLNKLEKKDDRKTLIHISPGTVIVSAVLTTFAIKGNRQLIYCNQDSKNLEEVNVDVWTLNELLKELWSELEESPKE